MQFDFHFRFAGKGLQLFDRSYDLLDLVVTEHDRFKDDFFRHFVRFRFHHHDGVFRSRDDDVDIALRFLVHGRVDDELAVDSADDDAADRSVERKIRDSKRRGSADHCRDFWRAVLVDAHDDVHDLNFVAEAFREQRTNRTVCQTARQNRFLARASFSFDEASGNFAYCV